MRKRTFTEHSKKEIAKIHRLSKKVNGGAGKTHYDVLFKLSKKHAKEIHDLYLKTDPHFVVETGDLMVLCLEIIKEAGKDPNKVMDLCYKRYVNKLREIIKGVGCRV